MSTDFLDVDAPVRKALQDAKVMAAIRDLRNELGMNQAELAGTLAKSIPTIQRYERVKPPSGRELIPLLKLARTTKRPDLIEVLGTAIAEEIPREYWDVVQEIAYSRAEYGLLQAQKKASASRPQQPEPSYTPEEQKWTDMLVKVLRSGDKDAIQSLQGNLNFFGKRLDLRHQRSRREKDAG